MNLPPAHTSCSHAQDVLLPSAAPGSNATSVVLAAGTWLSPGDELLGLLPAGAAANRCGPWVAATAAYFCSFVLLCGLVLVNFIIGAAPCVARISGCSHARLHLVLACAHTHAA